MDLEVVYIMDLDRKVKIESLNRDPLGSRACPWYRSALRRISVGYGS